MKPAGFRFAETYYLSPSLPFNLLSYLVRFGRIAEVTIKGAQGPQLAHLRRSANVSNEPKSGRSSVKPYVEVFANTCR